MELPPRFKGNYKVSKTETLDLCPRSPSSVMRQGGILFLILEFIAHVIIMRQVFSNVFVLFGIYV